MTFSEHSTAPRSPSALRLAAELAALRRAVRWQTLAIAVCVCLEALIAVMIRLG